jgi:hypothetical protein
MQPKLIPVLEMAVENGTRLGIRRAYKHNDIPTDDQLADAITAAIMTEMYEWFDFPDLIRYD